MMAIIKKDWLEQRSILEIILVAGAIFFILFNQYNNLFITRVANSQRLEIKSTAERVESYKISWQLIKANWLFGAGLGNYTFKVEKEIKKNMPGYYYQPVHNTLFLVWSEIGISGLIFYLIIIIFTSALNYYRWRTKENFKQNYSHIFTKYYAIIFIAGISLVKQI